MGAKHNDWKKSENEKHRHLLGIEACIRQDKTHLGKTEPTHLSSLATSSLFLLMAVIVVVAAGWHRYTRDK